MLPKTRRISKKEFPFILKSGSRFNSPHLLLYIAKTEANLPSRFAFSVSKKICKNAVYRNRYRRQGYSIISKYIKDVKNGYFCFFSFKKGIYPLSFDDLSKETTSLLSQFGVII